MRQRLHRENGSRFAVCLEYLGLNEYFAGNYAKAREYYDQVLAMPEPTASAVAQTLRMLTDVEIAEGNWDAAKRPPPGLMPRSTRFPNASNWAHCGGLTGRFIRTTTTTPRRGSILKSQSIC
ncbi:MAG: tetratricopeptide repeat protein [bacterium]|nr:tetratricopeptide repeat protein [bacterium]